MYRERMRAICGLEDGLAAGDILAASEEHEPFRESAHQEPHQAPLLRGQDVLGREDADRCEVVEARRFRGSRRGRKSTDFEAEAVELGHRVEGGRGGAAKALVPLDLEPAGDDLDFAPEPHERDRIEARQCLPEGDPVPLSEGGYVLFAHAHEDGGVALKSSGGPPLEPHLVDLDVRPLPFEEPVDRLVFAPAEEHDGGLAGDRHFKGSAD